MVTVVEKLISDETTKWWMIDVQLYLRIKKEKKTSNLAIEQSRYNFTDIISAHWVIAKTCGTAGGGGG